VKYGKKHSSPAAPSNTLKNIEERKACPPSKRTEGGGETPLRNVSSRGGGRGRGRQGATPRHPSGGEQSERPAVVEEKEGKTPSMEVIQAEKKERNKIGEASENRRSCMPECHHILLFRKNSTKQLGKKKKRGNDPQNSKKKNSRRRFQKGAR